MKGILKYILIFFGTLFLLIGLIGLLIPVFPTMPFLILSGLFYINSSEKLYQRVVRIKYFGPHVKNYVEHRSIFKKYKYLSIVFIWVPTLVTILLITDNTVLRIISITIGLTISLHILSLKTIE